MKNQVANAIRNNRHAAVGIFRYSTFEAARYASRMSLKPGQVYLGCDDRYWAAIGGRVCEALDQLGYELAEN